MDIENKIKGYFSSRKGVITVYLFGSVAAGKENRFSDVDVAVLFDPAMPPREYSDEILSIMDDLSRILDREIDVVALNNTGAFLKYQIIKSGVRIYEREGRAEHSFEARAIVEYLDFLPIRSMLEKAVISDIKGASHG